MARAARASGAGSRQRTAVEYVAAELERHALDERDLAQVVGRFASGRADRDDLVSTARRVRARDDSVPLTDLRRFIDLLDEALQLRVPPEVVRDLEPASVRVARAVVRTLSFGLAGFAGYIVATGIAARESALLHGAHPLAAFLLLGALLLMVGLLEGLQMGVALLRLTDLHASRTDRPRAFRLHRVFRTEEGTRRFMAGRQLLVITTVFFVARLTSFPEMDTLAPFGASPTGLLRAVELVLVDLGIAGALVTLWLAQLAPQFIANKRPQWFTDLPLMPAVFASSLAVRSLALTWPGERIALAVPGEESAPVVSAPERYRQAVEYIEGTGVVAVKKVWAVSAHGAVLRFEKTRVFHRDGVRVAWSRLQTRPSMHDVAFEHVVAGAAHEARPAVAESLEEAIVRGGKWTQHVELVTPPQGATSFAPGQVLTSRATGTDDTDPGRDGHDIVNPTKFLLFRVEFDAGAHVDGGDVEVYYSSQMPQGEEGHELEFRSRRPLEVRSLEDGRQVLEFFEMYPDVATYYAVRWRASFPVSAGEAIV